MYKYKYITKAGYGGEIKNKIELLKLENIDMNNFLVPKKGNAL